MHKSHNHGKAWRCESDHSKNGLVTFGETKPIHCCQWISEFLGTNWTKALNFPRCFMGGIDLKELAVSKIRTIGGFESRANSDDVIYEVFMSVKSVSCREVYDFSFSLVICTTTIQVLYKLFGKFLADSRKHFYLRIVT